jgi:uncharacterized protein YraI
MRKLFLLAAVVVAWASLSAPAAAATDAYTAANLNVRAGPGGNYPVIGRLPTRTAVDVRGCTRNMQWCDVSSGNFRGWVAGQRLNTKYRNRQSSVSVLGELLGLPTVTYNEREYWGRNYYDQDFYRARYGWNNDHNNYGWKKSNGRWVHSKNWRDNDRDGIRDSRDRDDDNDGIRDSHDRDSNGNGVSDRNERRYNDNDRRNYNDNDRRYDDNGYTWERSDSNDRYRRYNN